MFRTTLAATALATISTATRLSSETTNDPTTSDMYSDLDKAYSLFGSAEIPTGRFVNDLIGEVSDPADEMRRDILEDLLGLIDLNDNGVIEPSELFQANDVDMRQDRFDARRGD